MKKIVFLTGTRADFGKLKPLMQAIDESSEYTLSIFVTGMHMMSLYGHTVEEITKCNFSSVHKFVNQRSGDSMDMILAKTITGLSDFIHEDMPDLIVIHGDRVEALAGSIVGSLNNILVAHIEGGEVSGTIDELIRHSTTKLSHFHFAANQQAKDRLMQMGETGDSIVVIGSPDLDIMGSNNLPSLSAAKERYEIPFSSYGIFMFHPVTTELELLQEHIDNIISAIKNSNKNFIVIYPNNDVGTELILNSVEPLKKNARFRVFPSIRFECFLSLLKHADFIVGNSSAGIREAPFYGVPTINIGSRQNGRSDASTILNVNPQKNEISDALVSISKVNRQKSTEFGRGNSAELFMDAISSTEFWCRSSQKTFITRSQGH